MPETDFSMIEWSFNYFNEYLKEYNCPHLGFNFYPELKTEEGYSADIVRTYIHRDICMSAQCPYYVHTMSAQCPHNVRTMSAQHLPRETYILREMLCRHCADI